MRYVLVLAFLAGCAHRTSKPDEPENASVRPQEMGKGRRFACAMSDGDVYRDASGQERCIHLRPSQPLTMTPKSTTTNCYRVGDNGMTCTTD